VIDVPAAERSATLLPWHCWQPEDAAASPFTCVSAMPGVGECGSNGRRAPSTVSARKLSSEARMLPAAAWWLRSNSCDTSASSLAARWHSTQATPLCACLLPSHCTTMPGFCSR